MQEIGVTPDQETYITYVFPAFGSVTAAREALQVCGDMWVSPPAAKQDRPPPSPMSFIETAACGLTVESELEGESRA